MSIEFHKNLIQILFARAAHADKSNEMVANYKSDIGTAMWLPMRQPCD